MIYLGTPGRMVELECPATQQVSAGESYNFVTTLEGRRKAQVIPGQRRAWSIGNSAVTTPAEIATLQEFAQGAWGPGPFHFVSADAPITNLLTPAEASCDPVAAEYRAEDVERVLGTPPMWTPDGWIARSALKTDSALRIAVGIPVPPDEQATASAYMRGEGGSLRLVWRAADGVEVSRLDSEVGSSGAELRSITALAPEGAVTAELWATHSVVQVGAPTFTWTDSYQGRSDGQGCRKAVVDQVVRDQAMAVPGRAWSAVSFTVTEVG